MLLSMIRGDGRHPSRPNKRDANRRPKTEVTKDRFRVFEGKDNPMNEQVVVTASAVSFMGYDQTATHLCEADRMSRTSNLLYGR